MADHVASSTATGAARPSLTQRLGEQVTKASASLQYRDFRYLTVGSLALGFGQWFQTIGLGWLVLTVTGSPVQMAAVSALRGTLSVAATPIGGILADRFDRKAVAAWSTSLACTQALVLSLLVWAGRLEPWQIYAFAALEGVASGIYMPARQALIFNVVPRESLANAVAMSSLAQNLARVSGPPLAGAVIGFLGVQSAFLVLAVFKLVAGLLTLPIQGVVQQRIATKGESPLASMVAGVKYSFKDPTVAALILIGCIPSLLILPYVQMLPFFAENVLHRGVQGYGILATGVGWGSLLGLGAILFIGDVRRKGLVVFATLFLYAVFVGSFSRSTAIELSMVFLVLAGIVLSVHHAVLQTLLQLLTPDEYRGRVMALSTMSHGLQPLGSFPMAVAIEAWGPADAVSLFTVMGGIATLAMAVLATKLRRTDV